MEFAKGPWIVIYQTAQDIHNTNASIKEVSEESGTFVDLDADGDGEVSFDELQ